MRQSEEFVRFFIGIIVGLFVGPIIVSYMIILIAIHESKMKIKRR